MKKMKKSLTLLTIAAAIGIPAVLPAQALAANPFLDTASNPQIQAAIEQLAGLQVISGYDNHTFKPDQPVTRAELAKMAALALHLTSTSSTTVPFSDVASDDWFHPYVAALTAAGGLNSLQGQFAPEQTVSDDQVLEILAGALHVNLSAVQQLAGSSALTGAQVTRGEAALLIAQAQQLAPIQITSIRVLNAITLQVTFSAPIPAADLGLDLASKNFAFDNGLAISNVPRLKTGSTSTYIIPTPTQKAGTSYTLSYKGQPAVTFEGSGEKIALKSTQQVANDMFEIESTLEDGIADYGYVIAAYSKSRPGSFIVDENNVNNGRAYQILSSMRMRQVQITPQNGAPMTATYSPFTQATDGRQAPKFILPNGETFKPGVTYTVTADWATFASSTFVAKDITPLTMQSAASVDDQTINITMTQDPKDEMFVLRQVLLTAPDGKTLTAEYLQSSRKGAVATFATVNKAKLVPGTTYNVTPIGIWATANGVTVTVTE